MQFVGKYFAVLQLFLKIFEKMSLFHTDIDFDSKLIDLVEANPILYERDLRSTPYTDMKKKFELWSHIATSLNRDGK